MEFKIAPKAKLLYVGDPMCSWCWGITNHIEKLIETYKDKFDFELILGGLRPGGGDPWTDSYKSMLKEHWTHVYERSGQPFDYSFFDRKDFNYDTEPACRAVRVIRDLNPKKEFEFYKEVQRGFYALNQDPTVEYFYKTICEKLGILYIDFLEKFNSTDYKKLVIEDFNKSRELGVRGYPSVLLQQGSNIEFISYGYAEFEIMKRKVDELL